MRWWKRFLLTGLLMAAPATAFAVDMDCDVVAHYAYQVAQHRDDGGTKNQQINQVRKDLDGDSSRIGEEEFYEAVVDYVYEEPYATPLDERNHVKTKCVNGDFDQR